MNPINPLINLVLDCLVSLGFQTFVPIGKRAVFDILAKKKDRLILIKVVKNIDGIKPKQAEALKNLAGTLNASAILVGEKSKSGDLLDGIVYNRYGLNAVTPETLKDALEGEMPIAKYWKGKIVCQVDEKEFSELVQRIGAKELAKILGVSRETIYMYKNGMGLELPKAEKLKNEYNIELPKLDIFTPPSPQKIPVKGYLKNLEKLGFEVVPVYRGFDALAKERERLVLSRKGCHPNTEFLLKTGRFLQSHPVLVGESNKPSIDGIPVVKEKEIKEAKKAKDLIKLVKEREEK